MRRLSRTTVWLAGLGLTSGLIALMVALMPLFVSYRGELHMIDGPGVLEQGSCCVEPTYHWLGRTLLPLATLLFFLFSLAAMIGTARDLRRTRR